MSRRKQETGPGSQATGRADARLPSGVITALFTDIVGSTQLKAMMPGETSARRDAAYWQDVKEPHDAIINERIRQRQGVIKDTAGDSFCVVFSDAEEAVLCAVEIQEDILARAIPTPQGPLQIRVGLHTGFATSLGDDIVASMLDKAARVQSKAEGGQVLVSRETHVLVHHKIHEVGFDSAGVFELKGLGCEELFIAFRARKNLLANMEEKYRQHIIERFGKLTLYSVTSDKPLAVELEQVFVKLTAMGKKRSEEQLQLEGQGRIRFKRVAGDVLEARRRAKDSSAKEALDESAIADTIRSGEITLTEFLDAANHPTLPEEIPVTLTLNAVLREHTELTVLGAPGSGKTTLLKFLALSFARRQAKQRLEFDEDRLPLYITLRDLNKWLDTQGNEVFITPGLLPRFLAESYAKLFPSLSLDPNFFSRALAQKKCAVLLDGLDEIADSLKRVRAAEFVAACLSQYCGNRFVLTSRPRGYEIACRQQLAARCGECTIRDFDDEQIRRFAESWYLAVTMDREGDHPTARDHAKQSAEDLLRAMQTDRVRPLATNPLLLSILALIHQRGNRLPQRRVALYEECIEFLLGYWHQVKGGEAARELAEIGGLSRTEKRALLEPVALWLHERGEEGAEVSQVELEEQLAAQFRELYSLKDGEAQRRARDFVSIIVLHAGLLIDREAGVFAFAHLTFQEFLAARALADRADYWDILRPHLHDPRWREVTLLLAGHLSSPATRRAREDAARLLRNTCNAGSWLEEVLHRDLLLAFRCLCDVEQLGVEDDVRCELASQVFDLWRKSKVEVLSAEIEELFAYAMLTPVGALILNRLLALTQDGNEVVRRRAAGALGNLGVAAGTPEVLERLMALIQDGNDDVRQSAADALGHLGAAAATPEVLKRLLALIQENSSAVEALGNMGAAAATPEVVIRLVTLIDESNSAAEALGNMGAAAATPEAVARLVTLIREGDNSARCSAGYVLGEMGVAAATPEVLAQLVALSRDGHDYVRARAAYVLASMGTAAATPEVLARLLALSQEDHSEVCSSAVYGLRRMGAAAATPEVLERLVALIHNGDAHMRESAAVALADLGKWAGIAEVSSRLLALIQKGNRSAGLALAHVGAAAATPEVIARLVALSRERNDNVRVSSIYALGHMGAAAATPEVLALLMMFIRVRDSEARWRAALALGNMGAAAATREVLARLVALIQEGNDDVRQSAAYALGQLGAAAATPEVLGQLMKLLNNGKKEFRVDIAWACGQAGALLSAPNLDSLARFWRAHLASNEVGFYCGEFEQQLSSTAHKQLKHLAALHAALPTSALRKPRARTLSTRRSRKALPPC